MLSKENLNKYFEPKNFFNREMSWLDFNRRVLDEALNPDLPLLDKIKFLSIFFSNLDEFYMIRISGLKEQIRANVIEPSIDGATPIEQVKKIEKEIQPMLNLIYNYWKEEILPQLKENNIIISSVENLEKNERDYLKEYFNREIYPVLTPLAFDPGRPFPYISNLSLSFAILIKKQNGEKHFARVKVPNILPRLLRIENIVNPGSKLSGNGTFCAKYIWLEDLIRHNLHELFPGVEILTANSFRVTRNTDIEIQEDEADDLLEVIEENIKQRKFGSVTRLEVEKDMPDFMLETLTENLQITFNDIHVIDGPLGLSPIINLYQLPLHHLKEKPFHPVNPLIFEEEENIFAAIRKRDILLHHPYESFMPVIDFIKQASKDPDVLAIKQTLYRVGSDSPIIKYLIEAAERKKQVAVLVELKARFDEENNIFWARELEKAGVHVVYGLVGLKTHSKMTLVVRKESEGVKRYVHIATGNYNASTAKLYTDLGLFTTNPDIAADVSEIFNFLTGYSDQKEFRKLFVSPINTRDKILGLIHREITNVNEGLRGHLIFKMNSLVDPTIIAALYKASQTGVRVDLIIRGICCLIPQVPGLSENIFVRSIIGRFLEHSRIYYFYNNGSEDIYLSSADLMQRNLDRRIEATFPIEDPECKKIIIEKIIDKSLRDNVKARILLPNGRFVHNHPVYTQERISVQDWLMENASAATLKIVPREKK